MQAVCPTCNQPLDPTRAPVARVRGLKVVSYCSTECADAAEAADASPTAVIIEQPTRADTAEPRAAAPAMEPAEIGLATVDAVAEPGAEHPAERRREATPPAPARAERSQAAMGLKRRVLAAAASATLLLGMVIIAIEACPSSPDVRAAAVTPPPAAEQRAREPAPAEIAREAAPEVDEGARVKAIDPSALYARAVRSLRSLMDSPSPRLRRIAAMALSRTGDEQAVKRLRATLGRTDSALVRVQIAYCLARAGDDRGRQFLVDALSSRTRDVRLDAARALVKLGDDAGAKVLRGLLSYRRFRIGAAGLLARLGDPEGGQALRAVRESGRSSPEVRMRAAVALGRAGDASVRAELAAILEDGKYQVGAAHALAALGDRAAVPALEKQLQLDSFRVMAALALRRMGEEVDTMPLAAALSTGSEATRATSAEAILIVTGPERLAERD